MRKALIPMRNMDPKDLPFPEDPKPLEIYYGAFEFLQSDDNVDWFNTLSRPRHSILRKFLYLVELFFSLQTRLGLPFEMVLENRDLCRRADVSFCRNDSISFAFLLGKIFKYVPGKVVTLFHSLPERQLNYFFWNPLAFFIVRTLVHRSDHILTLSNASKENMAKTFGLPLERISVFRFGVDVDYWKYCPWSDKSDFILSVGRDMNRDFVTLCDALVNDFKLVVVSWKELDLPHHRNLVVKSSIPYSELRQLYQKARLVVVSNMSMSTESSGLMTTLQAMACGTPVVISDSPPMREQFAEGEHIFFFEPGNPASLQSLVKRLWGETALMRNTSLKGRQLVETTFNVKDTTKQLKEILEIGEAGENKVNP